MKKFYSKNKQEIRSLLLNGMCRCAENIDEFYASGFTPEGFLAKWAHPFKPSISDKQIFNQLIDNVIDNIMSENRDCGNEDMAGMMIMAQYYYPYYK